MQQVLLQLLLRGLGQRKGPRQETRARKRSLQGATRSLPCHHRHRAGPRAQEGKVEKPRQPTALRDPGNRESASAEQRGWGPFPAELRDPTSPPRRGRPPPAHASASHRSCWASKRSTASPKASKGRPSGVPTPRGTARTELSGHTPPGFRTGREPTPPLGPAGAAGRAPQPAFRQERRAPAPPTTNAAAATQRCLPRSFPTEFLLAPHGPVSPSPTYFARTRAAPLNPSGSRTACPQ